MLDLIYLKDGRLPDEPRFIAGHLGCSVRKWTAIRASLVEAGKLTIADGIISNFRADYLTEETRKYQDNQAEIAGKPRKIKGLQQPQASQPEPEPEEGSVPNGTGETPSSNDPPDDLAELRALEPKAAAWAVSRKVLCERGGLSRAKAGEIVGKLFRDHGLSPGELWEAAEATWRAGTEDPIPYADSDGVQVCGAAGNAFASFNGNRYDMGAATVIDANRLFRLRSYTVAALPVAGTAGRKAFVTDATAPTFLGALTGGGAVVTPVFDNGSAWVAG